MHDNVARLNKAGNSAHRRLTGTDPGLFGPESVTWRLHADPTLWVAGLRALYLQALHPVAMAAVATFSRFDEDPWGRLQRTADYVGTVTYGTTADARAVAARVRAIHERVSGVEEVSGRQYRASDPDLLLWVHCCEVDSFLSVPVRGGLALSASERDQYVREQVRAAELVGLGRTDGVPTDTRSLAAYFDRTRPVLRAGEEARTAARFVLAPPMPTWVQVVTPARTAWAGSASLAFALLPRWARRTYRLPGLPTTDLAATLALRSLRTALLAVPAQLRDGPHLRDAKQRLAASPVRTLEAARAS